LFARLLVVVFVFVGLLVFPVLVFPPPLLPELVIVLVVLVIVLVVVLGVDIFVIVLVVLVIVLVVLVLFVLVVLALLDAVSQANPKAPIPTSIERAIIFFIFLNSPVFFKVYFSYDVFLNSRVPNRFNFWNIGQYN
jgi:hypothetical protein